MKKYDVPLALAGTNLLDKVALARMLIDIMDLDELYEPLIYKGSFESLKKLDAAECFNILGVPEERIQKIEGEDAGELKDYDGALSISAAGNIDDARRVMELLKPLNPKKPLNVSDFETIDKFSSIIDELVRDKMNKRERLERVKERRELIIKIEPIPAEKSWQENKIIFILIGIIIIVNFVENSWSGIDVDNSRINVTGTKSGVIKGTINFTKNMMSFKPVTELKPDEYTVTIQIADRENPPQTETSKFYIMTSQF